MIFPPRQQFEVYNAILRWFPVELFQLFNAGANLFTTTSSALVSAVHNLAHAARVPEGKVLYRGLGGLLELLLH